MTPNELADWLEDYASKSYCIEFEEAAALLRQLQAENEALKDEVAEWKMSYESCHRMCNGYGMN